MKTLALLLVIALSVPAVAQIHFTATLGGSHEVPSVATSASGTGAFTLNAARTELRYRVTYQGLSGTLSAGGHFHTGRPGSTGPVVKAIASPGGAASATITGAWKSDDATQPLTKALVESLLAGKVYVNFHTTANPGGEIRGEVELGTALHFEASLDGAQAGVNTTAGGTGAFVLNPERNEIRWQVTYRGLSGTLAAGGHVHSGALGISGPVVRTLAAPGDPASATVKGSWKSKDGTQPLTPALVDSLIAGRLYVNFHTSANPENEIRGQLTLIGGTAFQASLEGSKEVPAVQTNATGTASLWLNEDRTVLTYNITYIGLSGPLSAGGHFHRGFPGISGGILKGIALPGDSASRTVSGTWSVSDGTQPLTAALAESLLSGRVYLNYHTASNPSGEIRGQLEMTTGIGFAAKFEGGQEVPANASSGTGTGSFVLNAERRDLRYSITYFGLAGPLSAGGHFHTGAAGANGPIAAIIAGSGGPAAATISENWSSTALTQPLTAGLVDSLLARRIYANFHTASFPGGEIRGQLLPLTVPAPTAVEASPMAGPEAFTLEQNYPNPFNPNTVLRFQLTKAAFVTLKVFDLLGQEVAVLVNDFRQPGVYEHVFDGRLLASGTYLSKLTSSDGGVVVRKMALVK